MESWDQKQETKKSRGEEEESCDAVYCEAKERLNEEQFRVFCEVVNKQKNVLICGSAGTGKTFLLSYIIRFLLSQASKGLAVTASTGIAAANLADFTGYGKVSTLHAFVGAGLCEESVETEIAKIKKKDISYRAGIANRWKGTDVLIVDEISMISPDFFTKCEKIGRQLREIDEPFGGLQLVLCGDWAQLEPVNRKPEKVGEEQFKNMNEMQRRIARAKYQSSKYHYCFEVPSFESCIGENIYVLNSVVRQKDDDFRQLLSEVRWGIVSEKTKSILQKRVGARLPHTPTQLFPRVQQVQEFNRKHLDLLPDQERQFYLNKVTNKCDPKKVEERIEEVLKFANIENPLCLKKGAPVILTANLSVEKGQINGLQGTVIGFKGSSSFPEVQFINGQTLTIEPMRKSYKLRGSIAKAETTEEAEEGRGNVFSLYFFPLKLAFALTIHKSQSLTLEFVALDLSEKIFAKGQAYAGLSRVTSLEGLQLISFNENAFKTDPRVIEFYIKYCPEVKTVIESFQSEKEEKRKGMDLDKIKVKIPRTAIMRSGDRIDDCPF